MRIRIAFGAVLGLAVAFAFVFLQFRAEAIAQQSSAEDPQPADAGPFRSNEFTFDSNQAPSESNDPFDSGTESPRNLIESSLDDSDDSEPDAGSSDPYAPGEDALPESDNAFRSETGFDSAADDEFAPSQTSTVRQYPLQIIRLRNVQAPVAYSIVWSLFQNEANRQGWFLSAEKQSNSVLFKGPTVRFEQIKRLINGLDRLAEFPADAQKKTYAWPVPHVVVDESSDDDSESSRSEWPIRIIRLRFVPCLDFAQIAWDLVNNQKPDTQLVLEFEPFTNTVVMRGPAAEIENVVQLAQQLDQPPTSPAAGDLQAAQLPPATGAALNPFADTQTATGWETLQAPADRAKELREQVAQLDARSVDLAREIRTLQKRYAGQHPKLIDARGELESLLEKAFQSRLQIQSIEVSILKNRLQNIESRVHQRAQLRKQIIDRRLHELLGEKDDLSWEVTQTTPVSQNDSRDEFPSLSDAEGTLSFNEPDDPPSRNVADELIPPTPYAGEIPPIEADQLDVPGESYEPDTVLESVSESDILPVPIANEPLDIVESVVPASSVRNSAPPEGFTLPTPEQSVVGRQELIVAENTVEIASLNVERIQSRLKRVKTAEQAEDLNYELRLSTLELDQARKLLDQKLRWIEAQRNSLKVNIQLLEKNLEVLKNEYELFTVANKKVPGTVPTIEIEQQILEIEKAELRLKQAHADLEVFEVENRSSRKLKTTWSRRQNQPARKSGLVPEPDSVLEIIESDDGKKPTGSSSVKPPSDDRDEPEREIPEIEFDASESLSEPGGTILEPSTP